MPANTQITRILIHHRNENSTNYFGLMTGVEIFNEKNACVLRAGGKSFGIA
jgi:hypothetical protein